MNGHKWNNKKWLFVFRSFACVFAYISWWDARTNVKQEPDNSELKNATIRMVFQYWVTYASETHEQHQARLDDLRNRAQEWYASEPDGQYQVRLEDARMRVQERRANESDEWRQIRLSCLCQRDHGTRGTETDEQRATRYQRMREYRQQLATNQPPPAPSPELAHQAWVVKKRPQKI